MWGDVSVVKETSRLVGKTIALMRCGSCGWAKSTLGLERSPNDEEERNIFMLRLIGSTRDDFAILASLLNDDTYQLLIYPAMPEVKEEIAVSSREFKAFLRRKRGRVEADASSGSEDVFIHSLTEADIRELMAELGRGFGGSGGRMEQA